MGLCRICLECKGNMSDIFNILQTTNHTISEKITYITGLKFQLNDGFTSSICDNCLTNLYIASQFKETALNSHEKLLKIKNEAKVTVKIEREDIESHQVPVTFSSGDEMDNDNTSEGSQTKTKKEECIIDIVRKKLREDLKRKALELFKFNCVQCNINFENKEELLTHKKIHAKNWVCEICGMVYLRRSTHYAHVRTHFPPKFFCDKCDYKSHNKHDLIKHTRIHDGTKQYQCEYCTSSYRVSSNLRAHIKRCHDKEKNYQCHVCSYKCFDKVKMEMHIDMHNDVKRHSCYICGTNFRRKQSMYKHIRKCHGIEPVTKRPGRAKVGIVLASDKTDNKNVHSYFCSFI